MRIFSGRFCVGLLLLVAMAMAPAVAWASAPVVDMQRAGAQALSLTEFFTYLEDPGGDLTLADLGLLGRAARPKA